MVAVWTRLRGRTTGVLSSSWVAADEPVEIDAGTTAWMFISTALVLLMIPDLAMFYGGLVHTKNVLGTMMHSFVPLAIIGVLWMAVGYALKFGDSVIGGIVGWNSDFFFLMGIDTKVSDGVPEYVLAMFQGKFAIITPALNSGALAERVYFKGYCGFITSWFLFVYCPLLHWAWGPGGWLLERGMDTARALTMTQISASSGAMVWMIIESIQFRKATALGFVSGILSGLVVITTAAGVVHPVGALILGGLSSCACYIALKAKAKFGYDDSFDCFRIHGVGSGLGVILLVFFLGDEWKSTALSDDANWSIAGQFVTQLTGMGATILIAGVGTLVIYVIVEKTLGFRLPESEEKAGLNHSLHGENRYGLLNLN